MSAAKTHILNHKQILQKLTRIAYQVYESNLEADIIFIAGVGERGGFIGKQIFESLKSISPKTQYIQLGTENQDLSILKGHTVILTDDVLNTGRTLMHLMQALVDAEPAKLEVAVLADRNHRLFPVHADYVGISMATTLQEHICFDNSNNSELQLYLM